MAAGNETGLPPIPDDIARIAGPLLLGHLLNWCLFGALSVQLYMYYIAFPRDRTFSKCFVIGIYLWEAAQTFMLTESAFDAFARGFGDMSRLDKIGNLWFSVPIMSGVVAFAGQSFYAYRISILSQSKFVAGIILLLAFTQLAGAIACGVESNKAVLHSHFLGQKAYITTGIWNGGSAVCDAIIAICMTVYLTRRDTGEKQTQMLLRRIIRLTIETGTITAVVAVLNFALASLPGRPNYYLATVGILGKLYANSTLAVFNGRMRISESASHTGSQSSSRLTTFHARARTEGNVDTEYEMTTRASATEHDSASSTKNWTEESGEGPSKNQETV